MGEGGRGINYQNPYCEQQFPGIQRVPKGPTLAPQVPSVEFASLISSTMA